MQKFMFFICVSGLIVIGMLQTQATHWWEYVWLALATAVFTVKLGFMMRNGDKGKPEGIDWRVRSAFFNSEGEWHFVWGFVAGLGSLFVIGTILFLIIMWSLGTPMERYTKQYEACIASEHFTDEQCHNIGLQAMDIE